MGSQSASVHQDQAGQLERDLVPPVALMASRHGGAFTRQQAELTVYSASLVFGGLSKRRFSSSRDLSTGSSLGMSVGFMPRSARAAEMNPNRSSTNCFDPSLLKRSPSEGNVFAKLFSAVTHPTILLADVHASFEPTRRSCTRESALFNTRRSKEARSRSSAVAWRRCSSVKVKN